MRKKNGRHRQPANAMLIAVALLVSALPNSLHAIAQAKVVEPYAATSAAVSRAMPDAASQSRL